MNDALIFGMVKRLKQRWTRRPEGLSQAEVDEVNAVLAASRGEAPVLPKPSDGLQSLKGPLVAIVGAVAATSLFATIPAEEGTEYKAYQDIASVWTVCQGDTNDVHPGLIETPEGCRVRLEKQLVAHAKPVMACTPRLSEPGRDYQRAAAVSLAYNIGVRAYCNSTADRRFDAGDWKGGCDAFLSWSKAKVKGELRVVKGLLSRRERERAICLRNIT